jgi:hypothetical protein
MKPEVCIGSANRGSVCYLCKEGAAIVATPRDLDDPDITPEAGEWYHMGLLSCWGCIRKILTMLMSDPKLPEREADALEDEVAAIPPERLGRLEAKIDAVNDEMDK